MNRVSFIGLSITAAVANNSFSEVVQAAALHKQPNVILILADDMGIGDLSAMNQGISSTPNLDRLIANGKYYNQAYSGSPVSAPARASLLTGRYPHATNCVTLNPVAFPELTRIKLGIPTLANLFKENGYATGMIGKWHCGVDSGYTPIDRGFDEFAGFFEGSPNLDVPDYNNYWFTIQRTTTRVEGEYLTENLSKRAVEYVRRHKGHPFFLHLAHYAPHRPLGAPSELVAKYLQKDIDSTTAIVYAMIEIMDRGIGELMAELEQQGILNNTLVIFTSDNGPDPKTGKRYNVELKGSKYTVDEGGIKIPFVLQWTGTLPAGQSEQRIHFADIMPTLIELCGLKTDMQSLELDGVSFATNLLHSSILPDRAMFWQWNRGVPSYSHNAAVRLGDWKLVRPYVTRNIPKGESLLAPILYNTRLDRSETKNCATEFPEMYIDLSEKLDVWSKKVERQRLTK